MRNRQGQRCYLKKKQGKGGFFEKALGFNLDDLTCCHHNQKNVLSKKMLIEEE